MTKPVYTQQMSDNGELPSVGMEFTTEVNGNYTVEMVNKKSVCFTDEDGFLVGIPIRYAKPIDTRTDKEKALSDIHKVDQKVHDDHNFNKAFLDAVMNDEIHGVKWVGNND